MRRRIRPYQAGLAILAVLVGSTVATRGEFIFDATVPLYPKVEEAIDRAQGWLAGRQNKNGSWTGCNGNNAMATVALMVNGTTPGKGKYGVQVSRGIDYLMSRQQPNGFLAVGGSGPMYQHALATLALAEAYGMTHNPDIRESVIRAIDLIVETQDYGGGWRYQPRMMAGDLSVTVMQVMALRACAEVGILVPDETINHAIKFVKKCWNAPSSSFGYTGGGAGNFNRGAAGVVCLQSVGLHDDPVIPQAIAAISQRAFNHKDGHYWYGKYYASVALYHYGGDAWKGYYPRMCEKILNDWKSRPSYGSILDTSWAILVLGVPFRYLPIYQR